MNCPCCGSALHLYIQAAFMPGRPDRELGECQNPTCNRYMITLNRVALSQLTDEQAARYQQPKPNDKAVR